MAAAWFSAVLLPVGSLVCSESFNVDCLGMDTYFVDMGLWFPLNFFTKVYMIIAVITCFCYNVTFWWYYQNVRKYHVFIRTKLENLMLCGSENLSEHFWHEIVLSSFGIYVVVGRIFSKTVRGDVEHVFSEKGTFRPAMTMGDLD